jgi:hypothetical protein
MSILPFEKFYLQSTLPRTKVIRLFTGLPEEKKLNFFAKQLSKSDEPNELAEFAIEPIVKYRSSFLPLITGTVQSDLKGSRIVVTMSLPIVTYALLLGLVAWALVSLFLLFNDEGMMSSNGSFTESNIFPTAIALPILIIAVMAFKLEVHRNHRSIIKRLAAAEMD